MEFTWQTTIKVSEEEAREWHFLNTIEDEEYDENYEPTFDDYYGAAKEAWENDDCEYDLV